MLAPLEGVMVNNNCRLDRIQNHPVGKYVGVLQGNYVAQANWTRKTTLNIGPGLNEKEKLSWAPEFTSLLPDCRNGISCSHSGHHCPSATMDCSL